MRWVLWGAAGFAVGLAVGVVVPFVGGAGSSRAEQVAADVEGATSCDAVVDGRTRIDVLLEEPPGAEGAWVSTEVLLDGSPMEPVVGPAADVCGWRTLTRAVTPGTHSLAVRLRYRRDVKILTQPLGASKLSMTLLPAGEFELTRRLAVSAEAGETLKLAGNVELVPASPTDRLTLAPRAVAALTASN